MKFSRKAAGLAAGSLMAALLVPVTLAPSAMSATPFTWEAAQELGDGTMPAVAGGEGLGFAVAWNDANTVKLRFLDVTAATPAWTSAVSLSTGCTSVGQPSVAMQDDSIAVAWSCDDTIQLATVKADANLDDSLIQDIAADAAGDPQVVLSFRSAGSLPSGVAAFYQGVSWVADGGGGDDTALLGAVEVGQQFIDDSVFEMGVGSNVFLTRSAELSEYTTNTLSGRGFGFVVDDSIQGVFFDAANLDVLGGGFSQPVIGTFATNAGVGDDTSVDFAYAVDGANKQFPTVTWVTSDDTVMAITGPSNPVGQAFSPADVTQFVVDDSPGTTFALPTVSYGISSSLTRTVTVYQETVSGVSQVILDVDDSTSTTRDDTRTVLGTTTTTPFSFVAPNPESAFSRGVMATWVEDDTAIQTRWGGRVDFNSFQAMGAFGLIPESGNVAIPMDDTTNAVGSLVGSAVRYTDTSQSPSQTVSAAAIAWVQNNKVYASTLTPIVPTPPGPTPGPPGPNPTPATPPSAPGSAELQPGNGEVTVSWEAPASQGSFPVTNYQVQSTPSSAGCLVPATQTQCTVSGLTDGTPYDFEVRALNGGGWGPWLDAGSVTPGPVVEPTIMISGTRGDVRGRPGVIVTGSTTGIDEGSILRPWIRLPGQEGLTEGRARITVDADGDFTWQRRTGKRIDVQIRTADGEVRSERITIAAR